MIAARLVILVTGVTLIAGCNITLVSELAAPDAEALRSELNRQGIAITTVETAHGYELEVAESSVARAVAALRRSKPLTTPDAAAHADALVSTRSSEQRLQAEAVRAELERVIGKLSGVHSCSVQLDMPPRDQHLDDLLHPAPEPAPKVTVTVVRAADRSLDQNAVRQLVARTHGFAHAEVQVIEQAGEAACVPCAELAHVGALTVTASSVVTLKQWLGASLLVHMLGALTLLVMMRRRRSR